MKCNKRGFLFCISFSLFFTVVNAASSALPGPEGFPPFPPDQEMQEEGFPEPKPPAPEEKIPNPPAPDFPENEDENPDKPPRPPKDPDKVFYYRGNRTYSEELPLKVKFVRCEKGEDGEIILLIFFNQSVNPRSVNNESLLIDDNELPENIRFSFNRKGDTIRVIIEPEEEEFRLTVQDVCTFNGVYIEPVELLAKVED
ncbi:MAG: hypothetical protein J6T20_06185 [Treponema sp.]|nr:hypothetical protein [Treponema sp.]